MSTFTSSNSCCVVQQAVFSSLPFFWCSLHCRQWTHQEPPMQTEHIDFCIVVNKKNKNQTILFFFPSWGHGDHHGSDVFFCTFFLLCLRFGADVLVKSTLCYHHSILPYGRKRLLWMRPKLDLAALSMCCNHRNICISENEIFKILPQLKIYPPGDFPPSSLNILWENGLLSLQVSGAHLQK